MVTKSLCESPTYLLLLSKNPLWNEMRQRSKRLCTGHTLTDQETEKDRENEWMSEGRVAFGSLVMPQNEWFFVCLDKRWQDINIIEDREVQRDEKRSNYLEINWFGPCGLFKHCQKQCLLCVTKHRAPVKRLTGLWLISLISDPH